MTRRAVSSPVSVRVPHPSRRLAAALVAVVALTGIGVLESAGPALAISATQTKDCANAIIQEWYKKDRIDKTYPLHCYRDAIKRLGPDAPYTDAVDVITAAMNKAAGKPGAGSGPQTLPSGRRIPGLKKIAYWNTSALWRQRSQQPPPVIQATNTAGPSAVPIPLLVLASLAGILILGGGAGYVARRLQGRRGGPPAAS